MNSKQASRVRCSHTPLFHSGEPGGCFKIYDSIEPDAQNDSAIVLFEHETYPGRAAEVHISRDFKPYYARVISTQEMRELSRAHVSCSLSKDCIVACAEHALECFRRDLGIPDPQSPDGEAGGSPA